MANERFRGNPAGASARVGVTTRREILKTGAAALALTSISHGAYGLATGAGHSRRPFDTLIVDGRIGGGAALSRLVRTPGMPCVSIRGDLARVWFDWLRRALLEKPTVVAGLTSDLDSELMRAFARDAGYRQEPRFDILMNVETGRGTIRRLSARAAPTRLAARGKSPAAVPPGAAPRRKPAALSSELERLAHRWITMETRAGGSGGPIGPYGPVQLAAWVVAPIRG